MLRIAGGSKRLLISAYPDVLARIKEIVSLDMVCGRIGDDIELNFRNDVFLPRSEFEIKELNFNGSK